MAPADMRVQALENRTEPGTLLQREPSLYSLHGRRVLFISYNGMLEPLGQSQVLPYLRELSKVGVLFTLLSFERASAFTIDGKTSCHLLRRELLSQNIEWHWLRYHKTPSLPATSFDVLSGVRTARQLVKSNQIEMVHARSHIPAAIGLALKRHFGIKLIFDVRGLMAEEYADAQHWREGSVPYRITKAMEQRALAASDGVVTLTRKIWPIVSTWPALNGRDVAHEVVPCCTDLDLFKFNSEDRTRLRSELGLDSKFTVVYSGSIDGWYLTDKMADFFVNVLRRRKESHFLWLTSGQHQRVHELMRARQVPSENYTVLSVRPDRVHQYLSASDAGIAFIKPCFSKLASSPTKYAEYLACGLPLIVNSGVGDSDALVMEEAAGVLIREFTDQEYERASTSIEQFVNNPEQTRIKARAIAARLFDVRKVGLDRYARLYERVLAG